MAQKTIVVLEDDVDGGEAEETVRFALDGTEYVIDLNAKNAAVLRDAFAPWVGAARRATRSARVSAAPRGVPRGATSTSDIRSWGRDNGFTVSERGRIPADLQQAYDAAH